MTLGLLGALVCPLMNLFILSQKINSVGENELRVFQTAQYYMEETRSMGVIDTGLFIYDSEEGYYERCISSILDNCSAEIKVIPAKYGMHYIEVDILKDGEVIYILTGSIVWP